MKRYSVMVINETYYHVVVEAENQDEAKKKVDAWLHETSWPHADFKTGHLPEGILGTYSNSDATRIDEVEEATEHDEAMIAPAPKRKRA